MRDAQRLHHGFGLGLPGEDQADGVGIFALHDLEQLGAAHAGHAHVRDHHLAGLGAQRIERRLRAADEGHLPLVALGTQHALQAFEHARLVVDEDDADCVQAAAPAASGSDFMPPMGRRMMNVVPLPGALDHLDGAAVLVDHHVVRDGQALARALADFLGGEERIEDALLDVRRHAAARVADLDDGPFAVGARLHADLALALAAVADHVADGVRGVDHHVQHHLVELRRRAVHRGQVGVEIHLDLGHVLPLVAGDGNGALDGAVEVGRGLLARRVRELLHRAHDLGDAVHALERLVERARDLFLEIVEVRVAE